MIAKQKISALSKAINIPGKEIAKVVSDVLGKAKSSASSLDVEEMSIVMEYFTQKFDDGSSIEDYLSAVRPKEEEKAPEAEPVQVETIEEVQPKKSLRHVDTRTNVVDLDVQLAKEKAAELAPDIKDTETNKQKDTINI